MQTSQPKLISYIIVALGFIGGYLYYSQGSAEDVIIPQPQVASEEYAKLKEIKIDFTEFDDTKIRQFKIFGDIPIVPDRAGKSNIFIP